MDGVFLSDADSDEFLKDPYNMVVCDWGTLFEIEPAISMIFDMPVGTDLLLNMKINATEIYKSVQDDCTYTGD